ncbi:hypothetical protein X975_02869, partial [Stegodyphus mimosarum]
MPVHAMGVGVAIAAFHVAVLITQLLALLLIAVFIQDVVTEMEGMWWAFVCFVTSFIF